jgi:putative transposase
VQVVSTAVRRWGVPQRLLSDNGLAFNPTRRGFTGKLVDYLIDLGVKPITGKPDRPTTQGKNERFHQTLQKWLNARAPASTITALQALVDEFDLYYNQERIHQALDGKTPRQAWQATDPAPPPVPEPRMPQIPPSARPTADGTDAEPLPRSRARLALHPGAGSTDLKVKQNGQIKALSCLFYVATSRAGQTVHLIWNETLLEIFADDGEHIISYPRPTMTGLYYGPRTPDGTRMRGAGNNPSAGITGSAARTVSKGGYVGVLANKFYAGYNRQGEQVTITWDASTVTILGSDGDTIAHYAKPEHRHGWHGSRQTPPSTKS